MTFLNSVRKPITALAVGLIGWATQVANSAPAHITSGEWIALATVVAVAVGIFPVANK